jgi:heptosyltransferase-2/heptosyltransferase-3
MRSQRPLVVRCGAFGDMVLITALIRELRRRYGCDVDIVTSGPWSEPLLRGQPGVGDIHSVRSRKTPYWLSSDQRRVVRWLRRRGVGPTWFCDGNDAARPMLVRAGIDRRCIVDVQDHPLLPGEHATEQWWRLAQLDPPGFAGTTTLGAAAEVRSTAGLRGAKIAAAGGCHLDVTPGERDALRAWLKSRGISGTPLIAIQVGNKRTMRRGFKRLAVNSKHWPNERWAVVLRHLRQRHPGHAILLLGTGPEFRLNAGLAQLARIAGLYNVADDLPVRRLMALLAGADGLVTVDSGPAHVGAAVGCPQVVLFGKASTSLYRPWGTSGADVRVLTGEVEGQPSMLGIEAAQVTAAWDALRLNTGRAACPA